MEKEKETHLKHESGKEEEQRTSFTHAAMVWWQIYSLQVTMQRSKRKEREGNHVVKNRLRFSFVDATLISIFALRSLMASPPPSNFTYHRKSCGSKASA